MQNITKPKALKSAFASGSGALKNEIPNDTTGTYNASFEDGFPAITMQPLALGGTPPDGKDMNGVLNVTTDYNFQFQNGFLPTFEQSVSDLIGGYPQGAILWYTDANSTVIPLISLIGNNTYNFNSDTSYIDGAKWKPAIQQTAGRNVGDIFFTARTDDELNGAVECNGAIYDSDDFQGSQTIINLFRNGKIPYISMSAYATLLANNGSVGVFGWDGVGTTEFRVPKLTDIFIETGTSAQVGDYEAPGVPNITGSFYRNALTRGGGGYANNVSGCCVASELGNPALDGGDIHGNGFGKVTIDASQSSAVYKDINTVQPNAVRYRAMIQLFISTTDEAVATCNSVLVSVGFLKQHELIEYQAPSASNNYTWYRKYRDGWVEQGGRYDCGTLAADFATTITMPVAMYDNNYTALVSANRNNENAAYRNGYCTIFTKNTTQLGFGFYGQDGNHKMQYISWQVSGVAA